MFVDRAYVAEVDSPSLIDTLPTERIDELAAGLAYRFWDCYHDMTIDGERAKVLAHSALNYLLSRLDGEAEE